MLFCFTVQYWLDYRFKSPLLVTGTEFRPVNLLVCPHAPQFGPQDRPAACEITLVGPLKPSVLTTAAHAPSGSADTAHRSKISDFERKIARCGLRDLVLEPSTSGSNWSPRTPA